MKVTVTVRSLVKLFTVPIRPDNESRPNQPENVEPLGVAVKVIVAPLAKLALQFVEQARPGGELVTVPEPPPAKSAVRVGPEAPAPAVKQTTFAVI